jgi:hypothetical protein
MEQLHRAFFPALAIPRTHENSQPARRELFTKVEAADFIPHAYALAALPAREQQKGAQSGEPKSGAALRAGVVRGRRHVTSNVMEVPVKMKVKVLAPASSSFFFICPDYRFRMGEK